MAERRSPRQRPDAGAAIRGALAADAIDGAHPPGPTAGRGSDSAGGSTSDGTPRWSLVPAARPARVDPEPPIADVAAAAVVLVPPPLDPVDRDGVDHDPLAAALGLPPGPSRPRATPPGGASAARPDATPAARPPSVHLTGLRADTVPSALPAVPPPSPPPPPPAPAAAPVPRPPIPAAAERWAPAGDVERLTAEVADLRRRLDDGGGGRRETVEIVALLALVAVLAAVLVVRLVKG